MRKKLLGFCHSRNTQKAYHHAWSHFQRWCSGCNRPALPANTETVALWVVWMLESGLAVTTAAARFSGVLSVHRMAGHPCEIYEEVRMLLSGARRFYQQRPKQKTALTVEDLRKISILLEEQKSVIAIRNRAVLVFGFASALRRSELVALDLQDISLVSRGVVVHVLHSKTDQEGKGRHFGVFTGDHDSTCPVRALKAWLAIRGGWDGPLFPRLGYTKQLTKDNMRSDNVAVIVKNAVRLIRLDPAQYGAHSLRAGCITAAVEAGASELAIMQRTGHKCIATVLRYVRPSTLFSMNPLARVL